MLMHARGFAACAAVAATAIALAIPAAADPLSGNYTAQPIGRAGSPVNLTFTPCGPDCTRLGAKGAEFELHLQGNTWTGTGTAPTGVSCTHSLDSVSLIWTHTCDGSPTISAQLTKVD